MAAPYRLALFGGFRLTDSKGRPIRFGLRKARCLLAYLALAPGGRSSREVLANLLWGDFEDSRARHSLRQCLLYLNRTLGDRAPRADCGDALTLSLPPGAFEVDVTLFHDLVGRGDSASLARAAALNRATFLDGLYLDAEEFDRWVETTRVELRDRLLTALQDRIGCCEDEGAHAAAVVAARAALEIDPLREDLVCRLMEACLRDGRPAEALSHYERLREALANDLGVEPDARTTRLHSSILGAVDPPTASFAAPVGAPLLESFLARLHLFAGRWEPAVDRLRGRERDPVLGPLLGLAQALDGRAAASEATFAALLERVAEAEPAGEILCARAAARLWRGEAAAALRDLDQARVAADWPDNPWRPATVLALRGRALAALGRGREARAALDLALDRPGAGHPLFARFRAWRDELTNRSCPARSEGAARLSKSLQFSGTVGLLH